MCQCANGGHTIVDGTPTSGEDHEPLHNIYS